VILEAANVNDNFNSVFLILFFFLGVPPVDFEGGVLATLPLLLDVPILISHAGVQHPSRVWWSDWQWLRFG
jgi:hypothetical protein